jgi:GAF domain-containing protein
MSALGSLADRARAGSTKSILPLEGSRARILDRIVHLAADLLDSPMAMITIVEGDRQVFAAQVGLPEDVAVAGYTPLDHSICQYAVGTGKPLVVSDARTHRLLHGHPAVSFLGVVAYVGMPLVTNDGEAIGTLCVVDVVPRQWSDEELARLAILADISMDELELQDLERAAEFQTVWKGVPALAR